jgi:RNA polymerase sigma factor (sigma-70 family)
VEPSDSGPPDAELVREALAGAREAVAELVARHWETAVSLTARVLGSAELGRDAAQEAAVAALTDLGRLRSPDRFGAWFCGIALNVSRRWLRQRNAEIPGTAADRASTSPGPEELAETADLAARTRAAVATLADGQRDAVLLFYLQGLSHREVAAELGISVGAVKSRLHQARAALAPALASIHTPTDPAHERITMTADTVDWTDVTVAEIRRMDGENPVDRKHIMILREGGGERWLPVWIGAGEATWMALALESAEVPRPPTYKLAAGLIEAAGSRVVEVRLARLLDGVFYASVVVTGPDGPAEVDARPSDAVNLALATGAPIRMDSALFPPDISADKLASSPVATAQIAAEALAEFLPSPAGPTASRPPG